MAWRVETAGTITTRNLASGSGSTGTGGGPGSPINQLDLQIYAWRGTGYYTPQDTAWKSVGNSTVTPSAGSANLTVSAYLKNPVGLSGTPGFAYGGPMYGQSTYFRYSGQDDTVTDLASLDTAVAQSTMASVYPPPDDAGIYLYYPTETFSDNTLLVTLIAIATSAAITLPSSPFNYDGQYGNSTPTTAAPSLSPQCRLVNYFGGTGGNGTTLVMYDQIIPKAGTIVDYGFMDFGQSVQGAVAITFALKGGPFNSASSNMFLCF